MKRHALLVSLLALVAGAPPAYAGDAAHMTSYSKAAKFENVRDDLKAAIENRGLKIDHTSFIHNMLDRTGKDVGSEKKIFADAQTFSFCSAVISRKTMEADPHNIVFCPYTISVYATAQAPGKVYVSYRKPQPVGSAASQAALKEVGALLDDLAKEALGLK